MSMSNQEIEAAVDKFVLELFGFHNERLIGEAGEEQQRKEIRRMLGFALPALEDHILSTFIERLEGEGVEAVARARYERNHLNMDYFGAPNWDGETEAHRAGWRERTRDDLRAAVEIARASDNSGANK